MVFQNSLFAFHSWTVTNLFYFLTLSFLYSYIISSVVLLSNSKILKGLFYLFGVTICVVNVYLYKYFSSRISPNIFILLGETNTNEALEFTYNYLLNTFSFIIIGLASFIVMVIVALERFLNQHRVSKMLLYIQLFIVTCGIYSFTCFCEIFKCNDTIQIDRWIEYNKLQPMDNISNLIYCFYDLHLSGLVLDRAEESTVKAMGQLSTTNADSLSLIVVIGESYIKWHSSLYGYSSSTTPHLQNELDEGRLVVFTDVLSPYNMTSQVIRNLFSTNCISDGENWADYPAFPAIFRKAGYEVSFWDNQYSSTSKESFDFSLNSFIHSQKISRLCYDYVNTRNYEFDDEIVDASFAQRGSAKRNQLAIYHLMGQHFQYYCRYPHGGEFDYFTADSISNNATYLTRAKRQLIADYDNATRYNDYVLNKIIDHYRDKTAILVYFSDHGDEVYDYQDMFGRNWDRQPSSLTLRYQYEVPFVVWYSECYGYKYSHIVNRLNKVAKVPLSLDNICHFLFHLGCVKSIYYNSKLDILSSDYKYPKRVVNVQ